MAAAPVPARLFRFDPFELDVRSGELRKYGIRIKLREQPVRILLMLLEKPGEVVLREEIRLRLWPNNTIVEFDHGINAAIRKLRDALGETADNPRYVETVARRGYRFLGEVERVLREVECAPDRAAVSESIAAAPGSSELEGKVLAHYRIRAKLGEGGMGVVYRADDLKLGRSVALKVLSGEPAEWPESIRRRFEREAQAASALNHPHICTVYGLEDFGGHPAIAMEFVEGETLAARLARGPMRREEALRLAVQIAAALAEAHAKGIIHRDLKPGNIMVTKSGIKVLDFGLARITAPMPAPAAPEAETLTERGAIIGTLHYMSPEQLESKQADARSDIFAFGLVFYEMVTGRRAFEASSRASMIAAILEREPEPIEPEALNRVLRACLAKDPADRFQSARDLQRALEWSTSGDRKQDTPVGIRRPRGATVAWVIAGALVLVAAGPLWLWRSGTENPGAAPIQSNIDVSPAEELAPRRPYQTALTLSPDGNVLVFVGGKNGKVQLYRRALDQDTATPIVGTEGGNNPFFSPDGKWLGFVASGEIRKIPANGGPSVTICKAQYRLVWGAAWGADGRIVFAVGSLLRGALKRVSADGGEPQTLFEDVVKRYSSPTFLPDGRTLVFNIRRLSTWEDAEIVALREGGPPQTILKDGSSPQVLNGYLFFMRHGTLLAAPFDARRLKVLGAPVAMLDNVMQAVNHPSAAQASGIGTYAVGRTGTLVYAPGGVSPSMTGSLVRLDRKGRETGLNSPGLNAFARLSPDGRRMISAKSDPRASQDTRLELYDLERGTSTTLTPDPGSYAPVWSPDGRWIAYGTTAGDILTLPVDGRGTPQTVVSSRKYFAQPMSWSPDGRYLFYGATGDGFNQMWVRPMAGGSADVGEPRMLMESKSNLYEAQLSPDGKWMLYWSMETGNFEVYVQAFPGPGGKQRISTAGGMSPAFARNGREIFYVQPSKESPYGVLMAVDVLTGDQFHAGIPHEVFPLPGVVTSSPLRSYDPYPDGQHFLASFAKMPTLTPVTRLNLVVNWMSAVKRRTQVSKPY